VRYSAREIIEIHIGEALANSVIVSTSTRSLIVKRTFIVTNYYVVMIASNICAREFSPVSSTHE
jgi:capsular polysaccharide biosynthesis protein